MLLLHTDSKMYHFVCFILLVSLEGLRAQENGTTIEASTSLFTNSPTADFVTSSYRPSNTPKQTSTTKSSSISTSKQTAVQPTTSDQTGCLFNLKDMTKMTLLLIIVSLILICPFLLVIIMCLARRCCRRGSSSKMVVTKSPTTSRRNSANGGPSETDILLKDSNLVKVEIETTPDKPQEPEELGGAAAEVGNQVSTDENKNSANDTSETAPTQEGDQSDGTDPKTEDLEKETEKAE
ncbi:uncharacterized protein LOC128620866 isoform X2 [Ictalurus furcatus]|uniref:uncharacterized protein LOC128620866 isoform X2 n=1 Tax=Ictalurus furcatus TaxID=66913 RepID=UPI002350E2B7|nr:uncharacterized protein LOC128620866 isoform X2 [Ictalurus furcatus]